jgi:hypothetical protein
MRKIRFMTVVAGMLASLAIAPAALAQPPAEKLPTYEKLTCDGVDGVVNLHVAGPVRMWDDDGNSYLARYIAYNGEGNPWGQGPDTQGAISCRGGPMTIQGFEIAWVEMTVVRLPRGK